MENKIIQKNQLERVREILRKEIVPNVSPLDKKAAIDQLGSSYQVYTFLKGECKDLDLAISLIQFFRKRIADRALLLFDEGKKSN